MQAYQSSAYHYRIIVLDNGNLFLENPEIIEEELENGNILYFSGVKMAWPTRQDITTFQEVGLTRASAKTALNIALNKKISAPERTNFLENNDFVTTNNC